MSELSQRITAHYQAGIGDQAALLAKISAAVDAMPRPLTAQSFAGFDQFHIGGLAATAELAKRAGIGHGSRVLDAGSGLGGPARFLAENCGCHVTGVDLTPAYVAIASLLAERRGLSDALHFQTGSITSLPFADSHFDLVWTQHVVMNIHDRDALYRELRRVLKPCGRLAFYDPIAADGAPEPYFPVPWASSPDASRLLTRAETEACLTRASLRVVSLDDVTEIGLGWVAAQQQQRAAAAQPSLALGLVLGARGPELVGNFVRNLKEGRVRLVIGIADAV